MDTETIAKEIVELRRRLSELDDRDGDSEERKRLHNRLRQLQDSMSGDVQQSEDVQHKAEGTRRTPDSVRYVPPA